MQFKSTRDATNLVSASQAILQGLAADGGLFVPQEFPQLKPDWDQLSQFSYQEMAYYVLSAFLTDYSEADLRDCINQAYDDKFDTDLIAPLVKVGDNYHLELFHGATIAFKDMALSILPYLMKKAAEMNDNHNEIIILTATSGDTGKAAMAGFADVPGTKIIVFYPNGGVSTIQEKQMLTQKGDNTFVLAVEGNFDDAQTEVKRLFNDDQLKDQLAMADRQFSSANSMNIGRLLPQVVYYFYAYAQLVAKGVVDGSQAVDFTVPTGNFGNILAGYYAKRIGLPVGKLVCASNDNTVLYDFFKAWSYDKNRDFKLTISPSMDILISSNFERMLYHAIGEDTELLKELMARLDQDGVYQLPAYAKENFVDFIGQYADEQETMAEIAQVKAEANYVMDPHTAVASKCYRKAQAAEGLSNPSVIVSTASPYKFPAAVLESLGQDTLGLDDDVLLNRLQAETGVPFPPAIQELKDAPMRHRQVIAIDQMEGYVKELAVK
ncbi:threonine synthase [Aerococcus urinaehominis]|nr:threonine synthase [Aerococcus urinaehominis]SDM56257.1 threonine synthase [Aerococcus urinaehominis]